MASIDDAIYARLAASTAITGIASSTGLYNIQAAQGCADPFAVFTVLSPQAIDSLDGINYLTNARLQIDAYASDKDAANTLALYIRRQLGGFSGFSNGIRVTRCLGPRTGFPAFEVETGLFREMREFSIAYYETTA